MQFDVISPIDNKVYNSFNYTTKDELNNVLTHLDFVDIPKFAIKELFDNLAKLLDESKKELATIITKEMGKPIQESYVEVQRTINTAMCCRDFIGNIEGQILSADAYMDSSRKAHVEYSPIGTALCIIPFNFPINLCMHKIGPSLVAGNKTIIKPNPQNYFSTKFFYELCIKAGFDTKMLALICPDIPLLQDLIASDDIDLISFTGGTKTADAIAATCGRKKQLYELGGNDPLVIHKDADLDKAFNTLINQRIGTCGQRCTAAKRVFVHKDVFDNIYNRVKDALDGMIAKDPMDENNILGPVVTKEAAKNIYDLCKKYEGLKSVKFTYLNAPKDAYFNPALAVCSSLEDNAFDEEIFGPVIPIFTYSDDEIDKLIAKINSTGYGLQSGIFTNSLDLIKKMHKELKVGSVNINEGPGFRAENFPFGGVGKSGSGKEGVKYTFHNMSTLKTLIV
ncbi:MAG: aldehyde dehydrogenase family protein [Bacteriovoracaceae bacterium]|jgi:acyl-CoA reductase-like NAD-dependent aldehyde dehydrogenase|nr:aldehyde dehydrogenase family protein [Bacteriovoracaceae bacterium]